MKRVDKTNWRSRPSSRGRTNMAKKAVLGLVARHTQADAIVDALQRAGFPNSDISALFPDKQGTRDFAHEKNTKAPEGAVAGAGAGGAIGGTIGLLAGIGALAIPGLGPFIAAGPIMAALSGAAAGARQSGGSPARSSAWESPRSRPSNTRARSRTGTSSSRFTSRPAMSAPGPRASSRRGGATGRQDHRRRGESVPSKEKPARSP